MFRLSKVVKMTGATRRALQEWDAKGVVHPTEITEGGYWLYDMDAVLKIDLVLIYREIGYPLKEIKTSTPLRECPRWCKYCPHWCKYIFDRGGALYYNY